MKMTLPALFSRLLCFCFSLLVLCICAAGCASFPGKSLPEYTYADLAPAPEAPEKKTCLIVKDGVGDREMTEAAIAILEKSGIFLKSPERCTATGDEKGNILRIEFQNDLKAGNLAVAMISGFISGATLMIVPGYARDEFVMTVKLRNDEFVKDYAYREYIETWFHLSMLFMMHDHMPSTTVRKIYDRMIMNFMYDYSRDVQQDALVASGQ